MSAYNEMMQIHPQANMAGDFSSNWGIIGSQFDAVDSTILSNLGEHTPLAYGYGGEGLYLQDYVNAFVSYTLPADASTSGPDSTYLNPSAMESYLVYNLTKNAYRGQVSMLPYAPGYFGGQGPVQPYNQTEYEIVSLRNSTDPSNNACWVMLSNVGEYPGTLWGWNVYLYENQTPFFYVNNNEVYPGPHPGGPIWPALPVSFYATALNSAVYDASNRWIVNVQLVNNIGSGAIGIDFIENYIVQTCPAWVRYDFYNNTSGTHYPGSTLYGGSGTPHWYIPGSGQPYSGYTGS